MAINIALKTAIMEEETSQVVIAGKTGIHESRVSQIIRGHREPSDDEKRAIAKVLKRSVHDLFGSAVSA
jgi:transcriptional regulator with XRE-family HTH domain